MVIMASKKYEYLVDRVLWENFPGEGHDGIIVYILNVPPFPTQCQYTILSKKPSETIDYGDYHKLSLEIKLKCPECDGFEQIESFLIGLNKENFEHWKFGEKIIEFKCPSKHKFAFNLNLKLAYALFPEVEGILDENSI